MYPVTLIRISKNKKITVLLKNNERYFGTLIDCDLQMNLFLKNVHLNEIIMDHCILKGTSIESIYLAKNIFAVQNRLEKNKK